MRCESLADEVMPEIAGSRLDKSIDCSKAMHAYI